MKKAILTLAILTAGAAQAMTAADAAATCRRRMESFLEIVKENKEAQLTVGIAMQLMIRLSEKSPEEVSEKLLSMLYTSCYEEMRSKEQI
jgi:hypothetical protein